MAVDTRNKRASCIGFDGIYRTVYPNPDGAINVFDRQQTAWKYAGIDTTAVAGGSAAPRMMQNYRMRRVK